MAPHGGRRGRRQRVGAVGLPLLAAVAALVAASPASQVATAPTAHSGADSSHDWSTTGGSGGQDGPVFEGSSASGARAASTPEVGLQITELEPVTVRPGRLLRVGGTVSTTATLKDVTVQLAVGTTPYVARSTLADAAAAAADPTSQTPSPANVVLTQADDRLGRMSAGRRPFLLTVRTDDLPFVATGVYPLEVRVTGQSSGVTQQLAALDTFLPWSPPGAGVRPTRLLWFWPLVDRPNRDHLGRFVDDGLPPQLRPGGRLSALVSAAAGQPVTWVVDPALLADVQQLSGPWREAAKPDVVQPPDPDARQWLSQLSSASRSADLVGLPYSDPDLVSVAQARVPQVLAAGRGVGNAVVQQTLGRSARFDLGWPAQGYASEQTLAQIADAGMTGVLLSGDAVPLSDPPSWTPSGRVDLADGRLTGLLSDPLLDQVVASPAGSTSTSTDAGTPVGTGGVVLGRQLFLAQTLLMTVELPSDPRLAVVAPPRRWNPGPAWADALMTATREAAWIRPVTLDQALARQAPVIAREAPQLPDAVAQAAVPANVAAGVDASRRDTVSFGAILSDPGLADGYRQALLSSVSTAWRGAPLLSEQWLDGTAASLQADRGRVHIVTRGATLSAESAAMPVTIRNELDQPVTVRLGVRSADALRLRVTVPDGLVTVPAGGTTSVSVALNAVTSGQLGVDAQLLTPHGHAYDDPVRIPVDVRAYGKVAVIVFGLAAALLLLAAAIRAGRRIRGALARRDR